MAATQIGRSQASTTFFGSMLRRIFTNRAMEEGTTTFFLI